MGDLLHGGVQRRVRFCCLVGASSAMAWLLSPDWPDPCGDGDALHLLALQPGPPPLSSRFLPKLKSGLTRLTPGSDRDHNISAKVSVEDCDIAIS